MQKIKCIKLENQPNNIESKIGNAGLDCFIPSTFYATLNGVELEPNDSFLNVKKGDIVKIKSGYKLDIPDGYYVEVTNRSSTGLNIGTSLCPIIDSSYKGKFSYVILIHTNTTLKANQKILQLIIHEDLSHMFDGKSEEKHERAEGAFGSTGK